MVPSSESVLGSKKTFGSASKESCIYSTLPGNGYGLAEEGMWWGTIPLVLKSSVHEVKISVASLERGRILGIVIEFGHSGEKHAMG